MYRGKVEYENVCVCDKEFYDSVFLDSVFGCDLDCLQGFGLSKIISFISWTNLFS